MKTTTPLVSVVIPVYNGAAFVGEAIESVLTQKDVSFELIIGNHSSTDNTLEVIEPYLEDPRVKLITTPAGGYVQRSWNNVTKYATAKYIKLVCADDVLLPGTLSRQVKILDENPRTILTACPRAVTDADGKVLIPQMGLQGLSHSSPGHIAVRKAVHRARNLFGEPSCVLMKTEALQSVGGWQGEIPYVIDLATYCRVLLDGDFTPDPVVGATFRLNQGQGSVSQSATQAEQVRKFHSWISSFPDAHLTRADVAIGNMMAGINARLRRISFRVLRSRMN